jgi:tetratricopeptide (TPR) repeat protein
MMRVHPPVVLVVLFLIFAAGCGGSPHSPPASVPELADPDLAEYLESLHAAALANPVSGDAQGELAMAYEINGLLDRARRAYRQAIDLDPTEFRWPYFLALMEADRGELASALTFLDQAQALDEGYLPALLWRGTWLIDLGLDGEAEAAFAKAWEMGGGPPAIAGRARALLRMGREAEALELLEALARQFAHPHVQRLLGRAYRAVGEPDKATTAISGVREAEPLTWPDDLKSEQWQHARSFGALLNRAQMLLRSDDASEAIEVLEALRRRDPADEVVLNNLSTAYAKLGEVDAAIDVLLDAIERYPESFSFHFNLANGYRARGEMESALNHLSVAVGLSADFGPAREARGVMLMSRGDLDGAWIDFERAQSPKGYFFMGLIAGSREDWPRAIEQFERSIALDPANGRARLYLGQALVESGRIVEGREQIQEASRLGVDPATFQNAEGPLPETESR